MIPEILLRWNYQGMNGLANFKGTIEIQRFLNVIVD